MQRDSLTVLRINRFKDKTVRLHPMLLARGFVLLRQTYWRLPSSAMCVQRLDDSQRVQVTLVIALYYVLHRCESQEIHC